jgi:hypothetical protein
MMFGRWRIRLSSDFQQNSINESRLSMNQLMQQQPERYRSVSIMEFNLHENVCRQPSSLQFTKN